MKAVLPQAYPAAGILEEVYRVPTSANFSNFNSLTVCNHGSSDATYNVTVCPHAADDNPNHYLFYKASVCANQTVNVQPGVTLPEPGWVVRVYSSSGDISFNLSLVEL